jgi:acyl-coenzyme A synthetase/AMP-(fatty) acid ligase
MSTRSGRPELAASILARGGRIHGSPVGAPLSGDLVAALFRAGVGSGDVVVLNGLRPWDLLPAAVATWRLDAIPMPLAGGSAPPDMVRGACRVEADLTVRPRASAHRVDGLDRTAVLHTTSGSTGEPKVARRGADSVRSEADGYRSGLPLEPGDRVAVPIPPAHSFGWGVAMSALLSGCDLDLTPAARIGALARRIDAGAVTVVALTASLARLAVATRRQSAPGTGLRVAMVGAGPVSDDLDEAFRARFGRPLRRGYGSTETGGTFLGDRGIGRPVPGVLVVEPPAGAHGELVLTLPVPVYGYLGSDAEPAHEWRTGDLVRHDPDGVVHVVARLRGPLRVNGRFVDVDAIDRELRATAGVNDVYVLVRPRPSMPDIEDLYAVVEIPESTVDTTVTGLAARLTDAAPVPYLVICDRLPRTPLGKPDRAAVLDLLDRRRHHVGSAH